MNRYKAHLCLLFCFASVRLALGFLRDGALPRQRHCVLLPSLWQQGRLQLGLPVPRVGPRNRLSAPDARLLSRQRRTAARVGGDVRRQRQSAVAGQRHARPKVTLDHVR